MFYSGKLTHMILHDDRKWPYSTLENVWEQYHDRYEGHCIVINAHWYDPGPRYCGDYKVQGEILSNQYPNALYGFKWDTGDVPVGMDTGMGEYENFLSTIPALINGERQNLSYGTGVERAAARTWIYLSSAYSCVKVDLTCPLRIHFGILKLLSFEYKKVHLNKFWVTLIKLIKVFFISL